MCRMQNAIKAPQVDAWDGMGWVVFEVVAEVKKEKKVANTLVTHAGEHVFMT